MMRSFRPPDFSGLGDWPALRHVVAERWVQAHRWHTARKRAGLDVGAHLDMRNNRVVEEVEKKLGRKARPFSLDLILLPVHDHEIRPVGPNRYLVPERVYDSAQWPGLLRSLVTPVA